jgi:hypothetical protein
MSMTDIINLSRCGLVIPNQMRVLPTYLNSHESTQPSRHSILLLPPTRRAKVKLMLKGSASINTLRALPSPSQELSFRADGLEPPLPESFPEPLYKESRYVDEVSYVDDLLETDILRRQAQMRREERRRSEAEEYLDRRWSSGSDTGW